MGMLQLAGVASGFGKGVGRGLEQMQQTMSTMQLMGLRDEMDRARMKETWGHEEGMLQKRQAFDVKQADVAHSRALDRLDQDHDFTASQARIGREEGRQKEGRDAERQSAQDERQHQARINELVVKEGYSQQEAARKAKEERAKEERDRKDKRDARREDTGKDIVLETIRGQNRSHTGKEDHHDADAQRQVVESQIKVLQDELKSFPSEKRAKEIREKIARLQQQQNAMVGLPSDADTPRARVDISQFDKFKQATPEQGAQGTPPASTPNLGRMGNVEPTAADIAEFSKQYEAAQKRGAGMADVIEAFKNRFGRVPTQADYDRIRR